jgi:Leucine-rich repeat (LRR) protein
MTPRRSHCITRAAAAAAATANLLASATQGGGGSSSGGAAADNSRIGVKSSSSGAAPAPLLQLQLHGVPLAPFGAWLQQRGQLGQLQRLYLEGWPCRSCQGRHQAEQVVSHFDQSWGWLTSLAGLQEMRLEAACGPNLQGRPPVLGAAHLQPRLTALQGLTQLSIKGFELSVDLHQSLSALTQLQQLQLTTQDHHQQQQQQQQLSWGWLTALRQLTHLDLSSTRLEDQLPADLGQALPHLEVLLVADCDLRRLPKGLTRLSRLDASRNQVLGDQLEALWDATRLLQLTLSGCNVSTTMHLTALTALEVLQLRGARRRCYCTSTYFCDRCRECYDDSAKTPPPSDQLQPVPMNLPLLVNLRHLDLRSGEWWVENLVAAGPLQHLTFLDLGNGITVREDGERRRDTGRLPDLGVLPSLQQLNLGGLVIEQSDWDRVGAWLGLQTQLTRLGMECTHLPWGKPSRGTKQQVQALAHLPTQLVELDLHGCDLQQLPPRLGQLTQLKVLLVGGNEGLPAEMLPWLPALQQLEVLEVEAVEDVGAAVGLLQQLPALRQFSVSQGAGGPSGEELDPAQELYGQLPHLQRVGHDILGFGPVWT